MEWFLDDGDVKLAHGDALEQLRLMPSESVQCIVTSPPFWGLRDYGMPGQIGLEETPTAWVDKLVAVMREARRVLRSDGVAWVELGDTYASGGHNGKDFVDGGKTQMALAGERYVTHAQAGVKQKDLVGAPWLLAFALRADGWYLRSDTIWARPNPMPESVTDRPTKAHSYVFLLTKSARYFYDADAIRETSIRAGERAGGDPMRGQEDNGHVKPSWGHAEVPAARNARSVQTWATQPTPFQHFATFPEALVAWCIKAGTSHYGACGECGRPESACGHAAPVVPCVVLDPFMGSGTTALVARRLGRHAIGIELNESYLQIAAERLQQPTLWSQPV